MAMRTGWQYQGLRLSRRALLGIVIVLWLGYATVFVLQPYLSDPVYVALGFLPGVFGVGFLWLAGFEAEEVYFRLRRLSGKGAMVLGILLLLMVPIVLTGIRDRAWVGWQWRPILLYAPADGIAQELFFRAVMSPVFFGIFKARPSTAIGLQAILFALYHGGMFLVAPFWVAMSALVITFLCGLGWGWQVHHDGTVFWAMAHHTCLQMILKMFAWG